MARTIDARRTRDIDLLSVGNDLDVACRELVSLARKDLGDFVTFDFDGIRPIKVEDEYRSGLTIRFVPYVGRKRMQPISIDLVVDEVPLERTEMLTPADRIDVAGIPVCDYLVYPVEIALSDKLHGIIETHSGRASSRVKDLVDIAVYATTCEIDGNGLLSSIQREARVRRLSLPESFALPPEWEGLYARQYAKLAKQTGLSEDFASIEGGLHIAKMLLDPALAGETGGMGWDCKSLSWVPGEDEFDAMTKG